MRTLSWIAIVLLVACERTVPDVCPDGTKVARPPGYADSLSCELPDGTRHGPWISADHIRSVRGSFERGKKHGVWRSYLRERLIAESHYHLGEKHGRYVQFDPDGTPVFDLYNHLGVLHGPCNITREEGLFLMGRRVGTWRIFGPERRVIEVREYDTGVLLSVDGRRLPPPPSTISAGTKAIDRAACDRDNRSVVVAPCRELFEAHQRCAVAPHPDDCRATAIRHFLDSPDNKP